MAGAGAALLWGCWFLALRAGTDRAAAILLLAGCVAMGGARHHSFWSVRSASDVARYAAAEPRLVRLTGLLAAEPWIKPADAEATGPGGLQCDRTIVVVRCQRLAGDDGEIPVEGQVRVSVTGHLLHARVGDRVEVGGWLGRPPPPGNPGEFDFAEHLRKQGARATLFVENPDAVRVVAAGEAFAVRRWFARLRARCDATLARTVAPQRLAVAEALLLGDRAGMTDDIRRAFAESGMMHLLAISGLHVGILAGFFWFGCRLLGLSDRATSAAVIGLVVGYALLADARPPVVRAAIFVVVAAAGRPWFRQGTMSNTLALAALAVLVWNPADLFDVGAQLSFLAVAAMLWCGAWWSESPPAEPAQATVPGDERWRRAMRWGRRFGRGYALVGAIWLFTLPWVAARFNLMSPAGFLTNVVLMPAIVIVLWAGYATLFAGLVLPELAGLPAAVFDGGLAVLLAVVEEGSRWELGHRYGPGPPGWWLLGYYGLLAGIVAGRDRTAGMLRAGAVLGAWTIAGLAAAFWPAPRDEFRCTFLSVGHGCAVLMEFPNGRTLLYDAGSLQDGRRAAQVVQAALWRSGRARIDGLLVSHADIDHFNGGAHLLQRVPVGSLLIDRSFLDLAQPAVARFHQGAEAAGVPVRLLRAEDRLLVDESVAVRVLHPRPGGPFAEDNANSVVLEIETAGRRILLTGDLEGAGLDALLERPSAAVDVLMSPHHGGTKANTPALAAWAAPRWVIVSGDRRVALDRLQTVYGSRATVLSTAHAGAVVCRIDRDGNLEVHATRAPSDAAKQ
ncbi:MAG: ComEC/Rec2 family competence protein [Planctomycetales bacterium]